MLIKALRLGLGELVILGDLLTRPRKMRRAPEQQAAVASAAGQLALYQFRACPFCVRTRRTMHKLNLPIELRDAKNNPEHRQALEQGGGRIKVPCLRIEENGETRWMYESKDIISYLNQRFA
ncbi:glutaredoxin [Pokkaliibacter plantistimulans]|uniref:Glutaredoxin n=1 Tax=Proteobacteria bacterium 228 TaxID=2083153 RepID=A0A2S5KLU1_9PROT|nr:glutaredoxin [Pokkaliibacter plantistimulans]PPC75791.1 glutaredoxin [Pokkaliibacter plantistimulans]